MRPALLNSGVERGGHHLGYHALFGDASLAELINATPRECRHLWATGTDFGRLEDNRLAVDANHDGKDILRAVARGRFWVNLTRIDRHDTRVRRVIDDLCQSLARHHPEFNPEHTQASLVISSPHAVIYLHADAPPMVLWQIRGRKRLWVYPVDERILTREHLEDIFADAAHEYLRFDPAFDPSAVQLELGPGQWALWPQNAPHRALGLDELSVSLSTEHFTREGRRKAQVYCANRFLRRRIGYWPRSAPLSGPAALARVAVYQIGRRLFPDPHPPSKRVVPTLRIDPDAPEGCRPLEDSHEAI